MKKLLVLLVFAAASMLPFATFAANPSPPAASYGNMHIRCGYSDGGVLTTAQLDCGWNDSLQQDGSGNGQELNSLRIGNRGYTSSFTSNGAVWLLQNAYTLDGTNFYPFSETLASFAIKIQTDGISFNYSPALNADGAITWTALDTWSASGSAAIANSLVVPNVYGTVDAATTNGLPAYTYNNGSAGAGATITGNSNGALSAQDGVTLTVGQKLLVKNEGGATSRRNNGVYSVTQVGDGSHPYILTRATDADTPAELSGAIVGISGGSTQNNFNYFLNLPAAAITIGTTLLPFVRAN